MHSGDPHSFRWQIVLRRVLWPMVLLAIGSACAALALNVRGYRIMWLVAIPVMAAGVGKPFGWTKIAIALALLIDIILLLGLPILTYSYK